MSLRSGTWPVMLSQDTKVKNSGIEKLGRERITRSNLPDKQVHGLNAFQEFRHKNTLTLIFCLLCLWQSFVLLGLKVLNTYLVYYLNIRSYMELVAEVLYA